MMDTKTPIATRSPTVTSRPRHDLTEQLIAPFTQLRTEVDRLFESFPFRLPSMKLGQFAAPAIEMSETNKAYKITAELPGIDPDEIEVTVADGILRIAGEKKEEREENERGYRFSERSYGAFERAVSLPSAVNPEKIDAKFKNGVLNITIAKDGEEKQNVRKIRIGRES